MSELKSILGIIAKILVLVGYIPYLRDIIKKKTKPHLYSWFLWTLETMIIFGLQVSGGAGTGAWVTLASGVMCIAVIILATIYKSPVEVVFIDTLFLILNLISLALWLITKQPVLSSILTTAVGLFAFAPTIRKSWNQPHSETLSFYYLNSVRFGLSILALETYSITTSLYPVTWVVANSSFAVMLILRRKILKSQGPSPSRCVPT